MLDDDRKGFRAPKGFSLIELIVVLIVVAVITAIILPLASSLMDVNRANETFTELSRIHAAAVGDPSRNYYGYIGDTGEFPSSLMDLVQRPASATVYGWNGPYLTDARVESGVLYDPFGSPYECYYYPDITTISATKNVADQFAVISRGPDRQSSNSGSNTCTSYSGGAMPSNYGTSSNDLDNVVYPRFTDNPSLLNYNHVGTLAINLYNFDENSLVNALVPGCPHLYTISVASVSRTTNDTFSMPYNPGANSVDLPQGLYKISVTSPLVTGALWQDQVVITPGTTVSRTATIYTGLNSSTTATQTFKPLNSYGSTLTFSWFSTTLGNVVNNATGNFLTPKGCSTILAQVGTTMVDALVHPYLTGGAVYNRRVSTGTLCSLTIVNASVNNTNRKQVLVYDSGLLVGVVSNRGAYKYKTFTSLRQGNTITIFDTAPSPAQIGQNITMGCPTFQPV
jgi:prepilin-type N-terminal cleavage/methylation domain-containing protein